MAAADYVMPGIGEVLTRLMEICEPLVLGLVAGLVPLVPTLVVVGELVVPGGHVVAEHLKGPPHALGRVADSLGRIGHGIPTRFQAT
ncbi:MAG TPA: hypothetical protein VG435_15630 [Acidimicrobiales bacterium]|jgi:hypothetical protein|nr:hypothetical protein [Acidimicrobiales bacterium]